MSRRNEDFCRFNKTLESIIGPPAAPQRELLRILSVFQSGPVRYNNGSETGLKCTKSGHTVQVKIMINQYHDQSLSLSLPPWCLGKPSVVMEGTRGQFGEQLFSSRTIFDVSYYITSEDDGNKGWTECQPWTTWTTWTMWWSGTCLHEGPVTTK